MLAFPLPSPAPLERWVALHGGSLDAALCGRSIASVAEPDPALGADQLALVQSGTAVTLVLKAACAALCPPELAQRLPEGRRWIHSHPKWAFAGLLAELSGAVSVWPEQGGTAPLAQESDVSIAAGARVHPLASLGKGTIVEPNAVIYAGVQTGARVRIGAGAVLGRPGFGFARGPDGSVRRIPHLGGVRLGDDVEVGALCSIDAGTLAPTTIGEGTKLDAQVHIGHNVTLGARCVLAAQVGIAGSVVIEDDVWIGGQAGIADHLWIGGGARIAAASGVIRDVPRGAVVAGYPAEAKARWLRRVAQEPGAAERE